jgi:hypothetical protein
VTRRALGRGGARLAGLLLVLLAWAGGARAQPATADVVVLGGEPEAIAAAVAAAEAGARTVLLSEDARLGGLFVLGALNVLDLRTSPVSYQQGLFARWWAAVGGGGAFDPDRAEAAFARLLREAGVTVRLDVRELAVTRADGRVTGARWRGGEVRAEQVVDGHADLAYAVAAGAEADVGWERFGVPLRMADTLVFRIDGVDWEALRAAAAARGRGWASVDDRVAWGHFGGVPAGYPARDPALRLRGLNLGRDDAGGVWANALLIHGVDPFDPASRADARARAEREAERVVGWLAPRLPGFAQARLGAVAERLYVRETRHLRAQCVLDADHLLDHLTGPFDVALGGYPLDVQSLTRDDDGYVFGTPEAYGVPLCVTVPRHGPRGLWAVGRSAGYDPLAHASARVVPLGMAVAEAVGVAAARLAGRPRPDPRRAARDPTFLAELRATLRERGAYLPAPRARPPAGPHEHPHFGAFRTMLGRGLAVGGYDNAPRLDAEIPVLAHLYLLANVAHRFAFAPEVAHALVAAYGGLRGPADAARVATLQHAAACRLDGPCPDAATPAALAAVGLWPDGVRRAGPLTRGESYALAARLARPDPAAPAPERPGRRAR